MSGGDAMESIGDERSESAALIRWQRWSDGPLLIVAVGSLPFLLVELSRERLHATDQRMLTVVNVVVLVAFALDYGIELVLSNDRRRFVRREWLAGFLVVSQAVTLAPGLASFGILRALRGFRAFRGLATLARVLALGGLARRQGRAMLRRNAAGYAMSLAALTWVCAAMGFLLAEPGDHSIADGLWWSIATMTTVGYGDIYPVTPGGRLVGGVTMIVGVGAMAILTAKVAEWLVRAAREDDVDRDRASPAERSTSNA